jgi:ABC-type transport system substrate-binding protein
MMGRPYVPDPVIGTGPFVLKSYDKGVRVVFERNPNYFMKGLPYLDGVVIEIVPDAAARLAVLRAGKAQLAHIWGWVSPEEARALKQTSPRCASLRTASSARDSTCWATRSANGLDPRLKGS